MRSHVLVLFSVIGLGALAQESRTLDSLRQALAIAQHDTVRLGVRLAMAAEWLGSEPDSSYLHCLKARELADRTGRVADIGETEGWLGYVEEQRGRIGLAMAHYQVALRMAEQAGDANGVSTILNNLAAIHKDQGRIDEALAAHARSLSIRRERGDTLGMATSLNNIGLILYDQGRIPEAMEHYGESLRYFEAYGDDEGVATALHNIAGIYKDQGDFAEALVHFSRALSIHQDRGDAYAMATSEDNIGGVLEQQGLTADALLHYRQALALHRQAGDIRGSGYSLRNIAGAELKEGSIDSALVHAGLALDRFQASGDKRGQASALWMRGRALMTMGKMAEAESNGRAAVQLATELGYPQLLRDAANLLQALYRRTGRWKEAIEMQDLETAMRDSLRNEDARRSAIRQQYSYAYEKKEAEALSERRAKDEAHAYELSRERTRRHILLGAGAFAVLFGALSYRQRRRTQRALVRSDELLLNILPEEVAEELKEKGEAQAKHFDSATILFTDFKGFTQASEKMSPQELVEELNACFKAFDRIIALRGIEKIKTIGDAYMAAGGLPDPQHGSPADVVRAALDMQDFMKRHKAERETAGKPFFEMRVGIHTGPVVAGIVGVKKFQYDIWGDTVNTASRMESSGEVGQVNISEATYALVKDASTPHGNTAFTFIPRGKVQAKGKGELEMFFVRHSLGEG